MDAGWVVGWVAGRVAGRVAGNVLGALVDAPVVVEEVVVAGSVDIGGVVGVVSVVGGPVASGGRWVTRAARRLVADTSGAMAGSAAADSAAADRDAAGRRTVSPAGSTLLSISCAQHEPNMKRSTHIPSGVPSVLMHSHTNMHRPSRPFTWHGFGLIW